MNEHDTNIPKANADEKTNKGASMFVSINRNLTMILACFFTLFIFTACSGHTQKVDSKLDNFNFRLTFNTYGKDIIDTYHETFTKDLVLDGSKTVPFKIPSEKMKEIYELMKELEITSLPSNIDVPGKFVTPECNYEFTATINGEDIHITWENGHYRNDERMNLPDANVRFLKMVSFISEYIYETEAYDSMPKSNGGYD